MIINLLNNCLQNNHNNPLNFHIYERVYFFIDFIFILSIFKRFGFSKTCPRQYLIENNAICSKIGCNPLPFSVK